MRSTSADWRTGKHVSTRFTDADGGTLALARIWQLWRVPGGEWPNSFAMLTTNAHGYPLMREHYRTNSNSRQTSRTNAWS